LVNFNKKNKFYQNGTLFALKAKKRKKMNFELIEAKIYQFLIKTVITLSVILFLVQSFQ